MIEKLLRCTQCQDIFDVNAVMRQCGCGGSHGEWVAGQRAVISIHAEAVGMTEEEFLDSVFKREEDGR